MTARIIIAAGALAVGLIAGMGWTSYAWMQKMCRPLREIELRLGMLTAKFQNRDPKDNLGDILRTRQYTSTWIDYLERKGPDPEKEQGDG